jgi:hypothetical protein
MATKIAVEVDVKTKDAASEIDDLKQQMEELKIQSCRKRRRRCIQIHREVQQAAD